MYKAEKPLAFPYFLFVKVKNVDTLIFCKNQIIFTQPKIVLDNRSIVLLGKSEVQYFYKVGSH